MEEQRELEQRVRSLYELSRAQDPRVVERKTPTAALDTLLRAAETDEAPGSDGEPVKLHSLSGAFTPASARRALSIAGRPFATGALVVTDGTKDVALLFTPSGVKALALGFRFPPLAKRLIEKGRLGTAQLNRLDSAVKRHRGEQEALVALGIPADVTAEVAAETVGQVLLDALFWSDPQFEAIAGEADAEARDRRDVDTLTLSAKNAKALVQSVTERLPELGSVHRALPTLRVPLDEGPRLSDKSGSLSGRSVEVLTIVSKKPGVLAADLPERMAEAGHGKPPLHILAKDLHELMAKGLLVAGKPGMVEERLHAPEDGLGPLARRLRLAKVLHDAGDRHAAARNLSRAGTDLLGRGRAAEAARCLAAAHALHGEDLEAHDGYVKALLACERKDEARAESEALVRRYLDSHLPGRARRAATRSLQEREEMPLLLLQLEALVALGEGRAIPEVGERVVHRLRQAGHKREAQQLADSLADHAAEHSGRDRILKAGGVSAGSPIVGRVAVALVATLALAIVPALLTMGSRTAYAIAAQDARAALAHDPLAFGRVRELFEPLQSRNGAVGDAAKQVVARASAHEQDWDMLLGVKRAMGQRDVDIVLQRCAEAKPNTPSMQALIQSLVDEHTERRSEALAATEELGQLISRDQLPEAYACAKRLLTRYADVPGVLSGLTLPITITSPTPSAALKWNKAVITQPLPFTATIPLLEPRHVEVSAAGHQTLERVLEVKALDGPEIRVVLRAVGAAPDRPTPPPVTPPAPEDEGAVTVRDGLMRPGSNVDPAQLPRFAQPSRSLNGVAVPSGWRARVDAHHEVQQGHLTLVGFVVTVEERQENDTWTPERPVSIGLPKALVRAPVVADGVRNPPPVPALEKIAGLDMKWLREQVQRAVNRVLERRQAGGR